VTSEIDSSFCAIREQTVYSKTANIQPARIQNRIEHMMKVFKFIETIPHKWYDLDASFDFEGEEKRPRWPRSTIWKGGLYLPRTS
jgi:hypothetical protein